MQISSQVFGQGLMDKCRFKFKNKTKQKTGNYDSTAIAVYAVKALIIFWKVALVFSLIQSIALYFPAYEVQQLSETPWLCLSLLISKMEIVMLSTSQVMRSW